MLHQSLPLNNNDDNAWVYILIVLTNFICKLNLTWNLYLNKKEIKWCSNQDMEKKKLKSLDVKERRSKNKTPGIISIVCVCWNSYNQAYANVRDADDELSLWKRYNNTTARVKDYAITRARAEFIRSFTFYTRSTTCVFIIRLSHKYAGLCCRQVIEVVQLSYI